MTFTESSDFCNRFPPFCNLLPTNSQNLKWTPLTFDAYAWLDVCTHIYMTTFTTHVIVLLRFLYGKLCCGVTLHIVSESVPQFGQNVVVAVEPGYAAGMLPGNSRKYISNTNKSNCNNTYWSGVK